MNAITIAARLGGFIV